MSKQHTQHALLAQIKQAMSADQYRLRRRLLALLKTPEQTQAWLQWQQDLDKSCAQADSRRLSIPSIHYDDSLPIAERREAIKAALNTHQVLIIAGETGSGKTTQLPKLCLELGRGTQGLIGHTQPRRLAARSVAARIAEELATPLGELVGYQVRYEDQSHERTLIKLMTDGLSLIHI